MFFLHFTYFGLSLPRKVEKIPCFINLNNTVKGHIFAEILFLKLENSCNNAGTGWLITFQFAYNLWISQRRSCQWGEKRWVRAPRNRKGRGKWSNIYNLQIRGNNDKNYKAVAWNRWWLTGESGKACRKQEERWIWQPQIIDEEILNRKHKETFLLFVF